MCDGSRDETRRRASRSGRFTAIACQTAAMDACQRTIAKRTAAEEQLLRRRLSGESGYDGESAASLSEGARPLLRGGRASCAACRAARTTRLRTTSELITPFWMSLWEAYTPTGTAN